MSWLSSRSGSMSFALNSVTRQIEADILAGKLPQASVMLTTLSPDADWVRTSVQTNAKETLGWRSGSAARYRWSSGSGRALVSVGKRAGERHHDGGYSETGQGV